MDTTQKQSRELRRSGRGRRRGTVAPPRATTGSSGRKKRGRVGAGQEESLIFFGCASCLLPSHPTDERMSSGSLWSVGMEHPRTSADQRASPQTINPSPKAPSWGPWSTSSSSGLSAAGIGVRALIYGCPVHRQPPVRGLGGERGAAHCASLVGRSIWGCFGTGALDSGHEWMASTGVGKAAMELCVDVVVDVCDVWWMDVCVDGATLPQDMNLCALDAPLLLRGERHCASYG